MLITLLSWGLIFASSFVIGFCLLKMTVYKAKDDSGLLSIEGFVLIGLLFQTVYAQSFSLFFKVGLLCHLLLFVIFLGGLLGFYKQLISYLKERILGERRHLLKLIIAIFIILICAFLSSGPVIHYDTDLYHAQSIRWIEEYGVLPGLGNLHNRLAYNSSFFSLQALFSMKFMLPYSLHSLNGFFICLFLLYSVLTLGIFHGRKISGSDVFKTGLIIYYCFGEVKTYVSSPGSDILTLSMVLYLGMKWSELIEKQAASNEKADFIPEYALLCLLAVWAVTIKLSSALFILLAVYPAGMLIAQKKWRNIACCLILGLLIMMPFLARNVIISGYLLYPYPALDLFHFDWKMPADLVAYDSLEIMAYGRSMRSHADYAAPFRIWFPVWYGELILRYRILVWLNPFCLIVCLIYMVRLFIKKQTALFILFLVLIASLLFWFFTSPLIRYGMVYLMLLPILLAGIIAAKIRRKHWGDMIMFAVLAIAGISMLRHIEIQGKTSLFVPQDYGVRECTLVEWESTAIYLPVHDDRVGYHFFPGSPSADRLRPITMRSRDLKGGFKPNP